MCVGTLAAIKLDGEAARRGLSTGPAPLILSSESLVVRANSDTVSGWRKTSVRTAQ